SLPLAAQKLQANAAVGNAVRLHQLDDLIVDAETRVFEVHRIDGMIRNRHLDLQPPDFLLAIESDDAGQATTGTSAGDAIEIDEADALLRPIHVADAGAQARRHEREVG